MMSTFNIAFALGLIALSSGVALVIWSMRYEGPGVQFAKIFGYIIMILSILVVACTTYTSTKMWYKMKTMHAMMGDKGMQNCCMNNMDKMQNENMSGMMQGQQKNATTSKDR